MGTSAIEQGSARVGGRLRTIHYGIGPIGAEIARVAAAREGVEIVGAVDIDPAKVGRDLGEVVGLGRALGVPISGSAGELRPLPERRCHSHGDHEQLLLQRGQPRPFVRCSRSRCSL